MLKKRWRWILGVTAAAALIVFGISSLVLDKTYETEMVLMIPQASKSSVAGEDEFSQILNTYISEADVSFEMYVEVMGSQRIFTRVAETLEGQPELSARDVKNRVTLTADKTSNSVKVTVKDQDPERAFRIAESLKAETFAYIDELRRSQLNRSIDFLNQQIDIEKQDYLDSKESYQSFLVENNRSDDIQMVLDAKKASQKSSLMDKESLLRNFESKLLDLQMELVTTEKKIETIGSLIIDENATIVLNKAMAADPMVLSYIRSMNLDYEDVMVIEEESNPAYYDLTIRLNNLIVRETELNQMIVNVEESFEKNLSFYENKISELQEEITALNVSHNQVKIEEEEILLALDSSKSIYEAFLTATERIKLEEASELSKNTLLVVSEPYLPLSPSGPNVLMNTAIGLVLGAMISLFGVFLFEAYTDYSLKIDEIEKQDRIEEMAQVSTYSTLKRKNVD